MDINDIKVDSERVEQGDWIGNIPEMGDLRLKVRGISNADYQRMMQRQIGAIPRNKKAGGRIDPVEMERVGAVCLFATVLLDWDGVKQNGVAVPYDKDLARKLCTEPDFRRFRNAVAWAAGEIDGSNAEAEAEAEGN